MAQATATCPVGYLITGGGYITGATDERVGISAAPDSSSWTVLAVNNGSSSSYVQAEAICAG